MVENRQSAGRGLLRLGRGGGVVEGVGVGDEFLDAVADQFAVVVLEGAERAGGVRALLGREFGGVVGGAGLRRHGVVLPLGTLDFAAFLLGDDLGAGVGVGGVQVVVGEHDASAVGAVADGDAAFGDAGLLVGESVIFLRLPPPLRVVQTPARAVQFVAYRVQIACGDLAADVELVVEP